MKRLILFHHLGLGDSIICNGIVNEYCKHYDKITLFCKQNCTYSGSKSIETMKGMYGHNSKIKIIPVKDDFEAFHCIQNNSVPAEVKIIGFNFLNPSSTLNFEKQFYAIAGVDFVKKWDNFYVHRNYEKEFFIKKQITPNDKPFIFVHDDIQRGMTIKNSYLQNKTIVKPDIKYSDNIFDFCTVIESAAEIHVIDSCFMFLVDVLQYSNNNQKLYIHRYSRFNDPWLLPELRKNWEIITDC